MTQPRISREAFLDRHVRDNPGFARWAPSGAHVIQFDRAYVALPCAGCCDACEGWHFVQDEEGARALHFKLFGRRPAGEQAA